MIMNQIAADNAVSVPVNGVIKTYPVASTDGITKGSFVSKVAYQDGDASFSEDYFWFAELGNNRYLVLSDSGSSSYSVYISIYEVDGTGVLTRLAHYKSGYDNRSEDCGCKMVANNTRLILTNNGSTTSIVAKLFDITLDSGDVVQLDNISVTVSSSSSGVHAHRCDFDSIVVGRDSTWFRIGMSDDKLTSTAVSSSVYDNLELADKVWMATKRLSDGRHVYADIEYTVSGDSDEGYTYTVPAGTHHYIHIGDPTTGTIESIQASLHYTSDSTFTSESFIPSVVAVLPDDRILTKYSSTWCLNTLNSSGTYTSKKQTAVTPNANIKAMSDGSFLGNDSYSAISSSGTRAFNIYRLDSDGQMYIEDKFTISSGFSYCYMRPLIELFPGRVLTLDTHNGYLKILQYGVATTESGGVIDGYSAETKQYGDYIDAVVLA